MNKTGFVCTYSYKNERSLIDAFFGNGFDEDFVEIFFQDSGAIVLVEEEDLGQINIPKNNQTVIIFRVYETVMSFYIECYRNGKQIYQQSFHEGKAIVSCGDLGSLQNKILETGSLFDKIVEDTDIYVWDAL